MVRRRRWARKLCAAFVVLHLGVVLLRGASEKVRDPLWGWVAWYGDGLKMANTWGMFSKPPDDTQVFVFGVEAEGQRSELASTYAGGRKLGNRVLDVRLRKVQTKLAEAASRKAWGAPYLRYFCRTPDITGAFRSIELELLRPAPNAGDQAPREVVLSVACDGPNGAQTVSP